MKYILNCAIFPNFDNITSKKMESKVKKSKKVYIFATQKHYFDITRVFYLFVHTVANFVTCTIR